MPRWAQRVSPDIWEKRSSFSPIVRLWLCHQPMGKRCSSFMGMGWMKSPESSITPFCSSRGSAWPRRISDGLGWKATRKKKSTSSDRKLPKILSQRNDYRELFSSLWPVRRTFPFLFLSFCFFFADQHLSNLFRLHQPDLLALSMLVSLSKSCAISTAAQEMTSLVPPVEIAQTAGRLPSPPGSEFLTTFQF